MAKRRPDPAQKKLFDMEAGSSTPPNEKISKAPAMEAGRTTARGEVAQALGARSSTQPSTPEQTAESLQDRASALLQKLPSLQGNDLAYELIHIGMYDSIQTMNVIYRNSLQPTSVEWGDQAQNAPTFEDHVTQQREAYFAPVLGFIARGEAGSFEEARLLHADTLEPKSLSAALEAKLASRGNRKQSRKGA